MLPVRVLACALIATPLFAQSAAPAKPDGLAILQKMSHHYAAAKDWYITAAQETTSWNRYSRDWSKTVMVGAVSANRYHFEGHSQLGSALHISDGTTAWDFHPDSHDYTREPAPLHGYKQHYPYFGNETAAANAASLLKQLSGMAARFKAATRLPDQTITLNGHKISCYVVRVTSEQSKLPQSRKYPWEQTLWIAKSTWLLRKTLQHNDSFLPVTAKVQIPEQNRSVTTYSTVRLNSAIPPSLFRFNPPPNAHLVAKFSESLSMEPNMAGRTAPNVQIVNAQGKRVPLSSYRGRPVLLDFWATWCAPCIASMPKLAELYKQATPKGLVLLSIDEDTSVKKADDYLAKHHYNWPNTQDDGTIGDAFHKLGIPLYALIDAQGKIVYSGFGPEKALRKAIAGLGPQFASLAPAPEQPCKTAPH